MSKASTVRRLLLVLLIALTPSILVSVLDVEGQNKALITGLILDEEGNPLRNAQVVILGPYRMGIRTVTDSAGRFSVLATPGWQRIYVIYDNPGTPGMDYVPAYWSTYAAKGSEVTFSLRLEKGASLYLEGDIWFVESSRPVSYYRFTVRDVDGNALLGSSVYTYGSGTELVRYCGFSSRHIVVPADLKVTIRVYASVAQISRSFTVKGEAGYFKLSQGEVLRIDIREDALDHNIELMIDKLNLARSLLKDAEDAGFLVIAERQDVLEAYKFVDSSILLKKRKQYEEAFADLRNAYIKISGSIDRLVGLLQISSQSAIPLLFFFVFITSSAAYLVVEREHRIEFLSNGKRKFGISINLLLAIIFYVMLVIIFYMVFPGCRLVDRSAFVGTAVFALLVGQAAVAILPKTFAKREVKSRYIQLRSAIIAAFSMACRNLRRRRMRTALTIINMMILIFGFISFTSVSPGYGLITYPLRPTIPVDALLIRDKPPSEVPFNAIPHSFLEWLENQPNVTVISPKLENVPAVQGSYIGYLYTRDGDTIPVQGILGFKPGVESRFTQLNSTIVDGRFLEDDDVKGVLLSSTFKEELNLKVGDLLSGFNQEFIIKGFFDPRALEKLPDIDGRPMMPYLIIPQVGEYDYCSGDETIILTYERALSLPNMVVSRVNVQLEEGEDYSRFAEIVVFTREYQVYVSHPDQLYMKSLGGYLEERGLGLIPILIVLVILNISASIFASVRERRSEIAALSSVGLNPTHIAALFMAEALVLGFIGGGLGYLLGLFGYRVASLPIFGALPVREKASAEWSLIALMLSGFTAVVAAIVPAMKASTIVTPSLLRRWHLGEEGTPRKVGQEYVWTVDLPVKLRPREVEPFLGFIQKRMREKASSSMGYITDMNLTEEQTKAGPIIRLSFKMIFSQEQNFWSDNVLVISRTEGDNYFNVKIICTPHRNPRMPVIKTVSYVRQLIFEWDTLTFEVATPYDPSISQLYTLVNAYTPTTLYIATTDLDMGDKLESLRRRLEWEGIRPPRFVISRMNPLDINQCLKAAEEIVMKADVVCVSGKPEAITSALALAASKHNKMICYVVDPRPEKERMRRPFETLKIVNL